MTLCGCGSTKHPVAPTEGVVLLDGKPAAGVSVVFRQAGLSMVASGKTDKDGRFELSTYGEADGAPVGECVATVEGIPMDLSTLEQEVPFPDNSSIADCMNGRLPTGQQWGAAQGESPEVDGRTQPQKPTGENTLTLRQTGNFRP